jgi:hypothetical protein
MRTRRLRVGGAFAAIAFAVLLGACSGGGGGEGVASAGGKSASGMNGDKKEKPSKKETEEAFRKFAQCMREHGVDVSDPKFDEDGGPVVFGGPTRGGEQGQPDQQKFEQANKECQHFIKDVVNQSGPKPDAEEQKKTQDQALKFAKCMRGHGIDMPDPKFDQSGGLAVDAGGNDPNDPKFREAQKICAKEAGLPKPGTKGPAVSGKGGNGPATQGRSR